VRAEELVDKLPEIKKKRRVRLLVSSQKGRKKTKVTEKLLPEDSDRRTETKRKT